MEITQFYLLSTSGGLDLKPISVEITYGLDRIHHVFAKKENVFDIQWNEILTYGDVRWQEEREHSFIALSITELIFFLNFWSLMKRSSAALRKE